MRDRVRRLLIGGADLIKCIGTGAVLTRGGVPAAPELSEDELRAAVEEAAHYGKFVAVHAHSNEGAKRAVRAGARSVEHGSMLTEDAIRTIADAGTFLSVDVYDGEWALEHGVEERWPADTMRKLAETMETGEAAFRRAIELGVRITYGTDSGVYPHELVAKGLDAFVRWGMTPIGAIRAATTEAAAVHGLGRPRRHARAGAVRGPRRGRGRPARGHPHHRDAGRRRQGRAARRRPPGGLSAPRGRIACGSGIDHLVIAVPDPDAAAALLEAAIGLAVTGGGRHELAGTFNRLAFLGDTYLELIGVFDRALVAAPEASPVGRASMALLDAGREGLATYALATDDVAGEVVRLRAAGSPIGDAVPGSRRRPDGELVRWVDRVPGPRPGPAAVPHRARADGRRVGHRRPRGTRRVPASGRRRGAPRGADDPRARRPGGGRLAIATSWASRSTRPARRASATR